MRRVLLSVVLLGAVLAASFALPAVASAGTFTWSQPSAFTSTPPGANPDHDSYGATPWSYVEGPAASLFPLPPSLTPSTVSKLSTFSTGVAGGLAGWTDSSDHNAFVARNKTSATVATVPAGGFAMNPAADHVVAVAWTSPLPHSASVTITGSITAEGNCARWSLNQGATPLQAGSGSGSISRTATVAPGKTIYLVVGYAGTQLGYTSTCATSVVALKIATSQTTAPAITLRSPGQGALISGGQPVFSGTAATGFGTATRVTVRVYPGGATTGSPAQTLSATRGPQGAYSVNPSSPLPDGQYTAQAEQDDLASPPDRGFSAKHTFVVHNAPPTITLNSPGRRPLLTATPTLTGTASVQAGDSASVTVLVYPGPNSGSMPIRTLHASRAGDGQFSVTVAPALPDGQYTALATEAGAGSTEGTSPSQTFRVKVHPPAVTIARPGAGARVSAADLAFSGQAGDALGDSMRVTVLVYAGGSATGRPASSFHVTRSGATWSGHLPHQLGPGRYTARATQTDDAGHTGRSAAHTFRVIRTPNPIGSRVDLSRRGRATVSISCAAPASRTCRGSVLILTMRRFHTTAGGPSGRLRVMFAYVTTRGGKTATVTRTVEPEVARVLRRAAPLKVQVTATMDSAGTYSRIAPLIIE